MADDSKSEWVHAPDGMPEHRFDECEQYGHERALMVGPDTAVRSVSPGATFVFKTGPRGPMAIFDTIRYINERFGTKDTQAASEADAEAPGPDAAQVVAEEALLTIGSLRALLKPRLRREFDAELADTPIADVPALLEHWAEKA